MARWENTELWDGKGNYLGRGTAKPELILDREAHICRFPHTCGAFKCPGCGRAVAWCRGAAEGPECLACWDAHTEPEALDLPMLLGAALLVFVILLSWPT